MTTLHTQVWIRQILEGFYPDSSFLRYARDLSKLVDNDKINLAEAGIDPNVLINNTTYPIQVFQRIDTPISIELDKFETENTLVRRPEVIEYAYDQLESVIKGHRSALQTTTGEKAAHAYAPDKDTVFTPIIKTTGNTEQGRKRLRYADIIELKNRYDVAEIPLESRYLVLAPQHVSDLLLESVELFKDITNLKEGKPFSFAGFGMLQFSRPPKYELKNGEYEKVGFGKETASKSFCSFAFQADEVMKSDGQIYMYVTKDDPKERGTIVGFDKRFIAVPLRNKGIGAIVSDVTT
jgi:hypothetical protein